MRFSGPLTLVLVAPLVILMSLLALGSLDLFRQAFIVPEGWGLENFTQFFDRADYVRAFFYSHFIALSVTAISISIALPTAHVLVRHPSTQRWLIPVLLTSLLISLVVRTFGWMVMLGPNGLVNQSLLAIGVIDAPLRLLFNTSGIVVGLVHVFFPIAVFSIYNALSKIGPDAPEAAMSLGVGPIGTFFRVILPLSSTGIIHGAALIYLMSVGAIVTPLLLGGPGNQMLGTVIYSSIFTHFNFTRAATVAIVLTMSSLAVVAALYAADRFFNRHMNMEK